MNSQLERDSSILSQLRASAIAAAEASYCPYSGFAVGAAVLSSDGRIFNGANVENASYGLTICAERNAIFSAVSKMVRTIEAIVIYTRTASPTAPCGACRQVMAELAPDAKVYAFSEDSGEFVSTVRDLLPHSFGPGSLIPGTSLHKAGVLSQRRDPRMCVDIDNVVAETDEVMRRVVSDVTNGRVSLAYEDVKRFNYWECSDRSGEALSKAEWGLVHKRFSEPERIMEIEPIEGARDALFVLCDKFKLHFATSRLPSARAATLDWLRKNEFPEHDIHFLKHGEKHASLGVFDVSVEDDLEQALAFNAAGFGMNFVLAHPWDESCVNSARLQRVSHWHEIVDWAQ